MLASHGGHAAMGGGGVRHPGSLKKGVKGRKKAARCAAQTLSVLASVFLLHTVLLPLLR
jgi:hypothetical protein